MKAAPHITPPSPLPLHPFILTRPPSIRQGGQRWHRGRFSQQDFGPDITHGPGKAGRWREEPTLCKQRPERTPESDGFQSAEPPGLWRAHSSGDPVKTVSLTRSTAVKEEVNIGLSHIHHSEVFLEGFILNGSLTLKSTSKGLGLWTEHRPAREVQWPRGCFHWGKHSGQVKLLFSTRARSDKGEN